MSKISARAAAALAVILYCSVAYAHAQLQAADPGAGATVASPKEIRITFSETVVPRFSGIELKDQSGRLIATGKSESDAADKKILVVPVNEQLAPGEYKVEWHAVSEDTHRIKGSYSFSVNR